MIVVPTVRDIPPNAVRASQQANGMFVVYMPGDTLPVPSAAALLADAKASRIAQINAECTQRILAVWPLEKQISALAGIYGAGQTTAMTEWVDGHIAASNTASDSVDAATTIAQVEAVTVTWPV